MNNKKNRKGFTIVELSIVVAVIAILAAVMIPVFSNITADARLAAARQNAKSIYSNYVNAYIADETKTDAYDTTCWVEVEAESAADAEDGKYVKIINSRD